MPLDHKVISRKLLQARQLQSLSIEEVSQAVGIEVGRIGQIESGQIRPSGDEVLILANFYRHDFRDFLDDSRPAPFEQTDILYRQHGDAFTPQDRRAIQEFIYLCEIEAALESEMSVAKKSFAFIPKGAHFKSQGESAAKALRAHLGYAANVVPRDVFDDFRQIGIHLFRRRLTNSDISGLYIEHPIAGHCALINYDEDIYRQRFSASHEAAHVIFDSSESVVVTYKHGTSRYGERDLKEIRANRFASCYLTPCPPVHPECAGTESRSAPAHTARHWRNWSGASHRRWISRTMKAIASRRWPWVVFLSLFSWSCLFRFYFITAIIT